MSVTLQEAMKILRNIDAEENNWRASRRRISDLLEAAQEAEQSLVTLEKRKQDLENAVTSLGAQHNNELVRLEGELANVKQRVAKEIEDELARIDKATHEAAAIEAQLKTIEMSSAKRISELNIQLAAKEQALEKLMSDIARLKAEHALA
jgi:chromosome segregation ATPase